MGDAGISTLEMVIAMPALLFMTFVTIHFGLWFHARNVAMAAAQEGARSARSADGTDDEGRERVATFLTDVGGPSVGDPQITVTRTAETVTVHLTGKAPAVIAGLQTDIDVSVTSPIEQFHAT